jgi:hypothetical protein
VQARAQKDTANLIALFRKAAGLCNELYSTPKIFILVKSLSKRNLEGSLAQPLFKKQDLAIYQVPGSLP